MGTKNYFYYLLVSGLLFSTAAFGDRMERRALRLADKVKHELTMNVSELTQSELRQVIQLLKEAKSIVTLGRGGGGGHYPPGGGGGGGHYPPRHGQDVCEIKYKTSGYNKYYYVYKNGSQFSNGYSQLSTAVNERDKFVRSGTCVVSYSLPTCNIEYKKSGYNNYYYVTMNGSNFTGGYSQVATAASMLKKAADSKVCRVPSDYEIGRCDIERRASGYNNYYYVVKRGAVISGGYSQFETANSMKNKLAESFMCSKY